MEAPNKIFVRDFGNSLCKVWTYNKGKKKGDVDVKYIRKDLLLEWLNGVKSDPMIPMNIDKVIDYIKAL